jgi:hypothetical protein
MQPDAALFDMSPNRRRRLDVNLGRTPSIWKEPAMKGWLLVVLGVVLAVVGVVWALQGFDVMGGSVMSGVTLWAVIGPIVAVVGLVVAVLGARTARRSTPS